MGSIDDANVGISQRSVDTPWGLKVIVIGAGVSGILAAIKLQTLVKSLDLVIYDKNEELGGTWFEDKYPGCACGICEITAIIPCYHPGQTYQLIAISSLSTPIMMPLCISKHRRDLVP